MRRTLIFLELANTFEIRVSGRTSQMLREKLEKFPFFSSQSIQEDFTEQNDQNNKKNARENPPKDCQIKCWKRHIFAKTQKNDTQFTIFIQTIFCEW